MAGTGNKPYLRLRANPFLLLRYLRAGLITCHQPRRYLDRKWALRGEQSSGYLSLHFEVTEPGTPVAVCEVPCPWGRCPEGHASLASSGVEFQLGTFTPRRMISRYPPAHPVDANSSHASPLLQLLVESKVCYEIRTNFNGDAGLDVGSHIIRMRVIKKQSYVLLSHLIWY